MKRIVKLLVASSSLFFLGGCASVADEELANSEPGSAASGSQARSVDATAESCTLNADTGEYACFKDFDTAKASIHGANIGGSSADGKSIADSTGDGPYILAVLYDDVRFGGASLFVYNSDGCSIFKSGRKKRFPIMPGGWNDRVSSYKGTPYNCRVKIFADGNFTGPSHGPYLESDWVGSSMNDKTSSFEIWYLD